MASKDYNFINRIRSLQNFCSNSNDNYPSAILITPGVDARSNKNALQLIKYLFMESYGKDLLDYTLDDKNECLEDIVMLIQESSICVVWDHKMRDLIGSKLMQATMVIEYITSAAEEDDIDLYQNRKMINFKRMMLEASGAGSKIGIAVPIGYESIYDVESWALIQSFASEDVLCKSVGFFTKMYDVVDISEQLDILYRTVDGPCVDNAINMANSIILINALQVVSMLDSQTHDQRRKVTAEDAISPLEMIYEFGTMDSAFSVDSSLKPILLFGKDTNYIGNYNSSSTHISVKNWEKKCAEESLHTVYEAYEPSSGLRWCRTYLLKRGKCLDYLEDLDSLTREAENYRSNARGNESDDIDDIDVDGGIMEQDDEDIAIASRVKEYQNGTNSSLKSCPAVITQKIDRLESLYVKLSVGLKAIIRKLFNYEKDILEAANKFHLLIDLFMKGKYDEMNNAVEGLRCAIDLESISGEGFDLNDIVLGKNEQVQVHIDCLDALGRIVSIEDIDDMGGRCWVYVRLSVHNIDISVGGDMADRESGAVAIGDTFLFAPVNCFADGGFSPCSNATLALASDCWCATNVIPYYRCLQGGGAEEYSSLRLLSFLRSIHMSPLLGMGKPLTISSSGLVNITMLTDNPIMPFINAAEIRPFSNGFVIEKMNNSSSPVIISIRQHVESIQTMTITNFFNNMIDALDINCNEKFMDDHVNIPEGNVIIFVLKNFNSSSSKSKSGHTSTDLDRDVEELLGKSRWNKYNNYNTLARAMPTSAVRSECNSTIALFIPSSSRFSSTMSAVLSDWRAASRIFGVDEFKGASLDQKNKAISKIIYHSFLQAINFWTVSKDKNLNFYDVTNDISDVSSDIIIDVVSDTVVKMTKSIYNGSLSMKSMHILSDSQRLNYGSNNKYVDTNENVAVDTNNKALFLISKAGLSSPVISYEMTKRLKNTISNKKYSFANIYIDFNKALIKYCLSNKKVANMLDGNDISAIFESTIENEIAKYNKSLLKNGSTSTHRVVIVTLTITPRLHFSIQDTIIYISCQLRAVPESIMSLVSGMSIGLEDNNESAIPSLGFEVERSTTLTLIDPTIIDTVIIMDETSDNKSDLSYPKIRGYIESVNKNATIFKLTPINIRLNETFIESLVELIEKPTSNSKNYAVKIKNPIKVENSHNICCSNSTYVVKNGITLFYDEAAATANINMMARKSVSNEFKLHYRLSKETKLIDKSITNFSVKLSSGSPGVSAVYWDMVNLISTLQLLLPNAVINNKLESSWTIPPNFDNSRGFKRLIALAKIKVMSQKYNAESKLNYKSGIVKLGSKYPKNLIKTIHRNIFGISGIITLRNNEFFKSTKKNDDNSDVCYVSVECTSASIVIRQIEDVDGLVSSNSTFYNFINELNIFGVLSTTDKSYIVDIINCCHRFKLQKTPHIYIKDSSVINNIKGDQMLLLKIQDLYKNQVKLPENCWFDGTMYVSMSGLKSLVRPDVDALIDLYVVHENSKIDKYNELVDLFEEVSIR